MHSARQHVAHRSPSFAAPAHLPTRPIGGCSSLPPSGRSASICVDGCSKMDLVYHHISTMFICAWTAIHPNIPPRENVLKRRLRRLGWTIAAPETLSCWALNQLLASEMCTTKEKVCRGNIKLVQVIRGGPMKRWF